MTTMPSKVTIPAGTRALAFVAATAGLAEAGADASAAALGRLLRARRWFEVVQAHDLSFLDLQHVGDLIDHAAIGRGIVHNNGVMAAAQAQAHDTGAVGMTSAEKAAQQRQFDFLCGGHDISSRSLRRACRAWRRRTRHHTYCRAL